MAGSRLPPGKATSGQMARRHQHAGSLLAVGLLLLGIQGSLASCSWTHPISCDTDAALARPQKCKHRVRYCAMLVRAQAT